MELDKLTRKTIGCAYDVSNSPGIGFVEKVCENAPYHFESVAWLGYQRKKIEPRMKAMKGI